MVRKCLTLLLFVATAGGSIPARMSVAAPVAPDPRLAAARESLDALNYADAESLAAAALADAERLNGAESPEALTALDELVQILARSPRGAAAGTRSLARRAVAIHEKRPGDGHGLAVSRLRLATVYQRGALLDSARVAGEQALTDARALVPPDPFLTGQVQTRLADLSVASSDYKGARVLAEAGLASMSEAGAAADSLQLALAELVMGKVLLRSGEPEVARLHLERALAIRERNLGSRHPDLINILQQLATYHGLHGDFRASCRVLERAIEIVNNQPESDVALIGSLYSQASNFYGRSGDYAEAARLARLSLTARDAVYGREHSLTAQSLISLTGALSHLGDYVHALESGEEAVAILRRVSSPKSEDLAYGLSTLGSVCLVREEWDRARVVFGEAASIREAIYGADNPSLAFLLSCMAEAQLHLGDLAGAAATFERVAGIQETRDPLSFEMTLMNLARVRRQAGRLDSSLEMLNRGKALCDTLLGSGTDVGRENGRLRLEVLLQLGRRDEVLEGALTMEREERETLRLTASRVAEREATAALAIRYNTLDLALAMAADSTGLTSADLELTWEELVRSRALLLDVLAERRRRLREAGGPFTSFSAAVDSAQSALAQHLVRARRPDAALWQAGSDSLRVVLEKAERALGERSAEFLERSELKEAGIREIIGKLPRESCLVSCVRFSLPPDAAGEAAVRYLALVYNAAKKRMSAVPLGDADLLEGVVRRWLALAGRPPDSDPVVAARGERDLLEAGLAVRRAMWDPLASQVGDASLIYLVPDGILHLVNPAALPEPDGGFFVDRGPLWALLTTERDLLLEPPGSADRGLLVVGGPDFDRDASPAISGAHPLAVLDEFRSAVPDSDHIRFAPLSGAVSEGEEIARLWQGAGNEDAFILSGPQATETAFARSAAGHRILHFATHGFTLGGASPGGGGPPISSRGVGGVISSSPAQRRPLPGSAPLSVYGLAMAGINRARTESTGPDDGFLTGAEISALPLQDTEWAVLSACRTGVADVDQPESVQGLHRAFRLAGVRTVVMSLWAVQDEPTREWMVELYRSRLNGADTPEAVRAAQKAVLQARRSRGESTHPFYWAPFIAVGSPR